VSLLEEFKIEEGKHTETSYPTHDETADKLGATQVHYKVVDTTRWGQIVEYVYELDDEYVRVRYEEASGDGETYYEPDIVAVEPQQVTVTKYVAV
jgi:hypothetical protein